MKDVSVVKVKAEIPGEGEASTLTRTGSSKGSLPSSSTLREKVFTLALLTSCYLLPRLLLFSWRGHKGDAITFGYWGELLTRRSMDQIYRKDQFTPDHLPSDLSLHWLLSHAYTFFGGADFRGDAYGRSLKVLPLLTDLGLMALAYLFLSIVKSPRVGVIAAGVVALLPPLWINSAWWGQWDSVSLFLLLAGCYLGWRHPRLLFIGVALTVLAASIKPPLVLVVAPMLFVALAVSLRDGLGKRGWEPFLSLVTHSLGGLVVGSLLVLWNASVYSVKLGNKAGAYSIMELVKAAEERWPYRSMGAPNQWGLLQGQKDLVRDSDRLFGAWDAHTTGIALFIGLFSLVLLSLIVGAFSGIVDYTSLALWGGAALSWSSFFVLTRGHERYLIPAIVLAAVLALLEGSLVSLGAFLFLALGGTVAVGGAVLDGGRGLLPHALWMFAGLSCLVGGCLLFFGVFMSAGLLEKVDDEGTDSLE